MRKLRFTTALAAIGLFAASQAAPANSLSPQLNTAEAANSPIIRVAAHSGSMGSGGHAMSMGGTGVRSGGVHNFAIGHRPMMGQGRTFAHNFHHGRHFRGGPFIGFGYDYGYPDSYGGGSCYWNCRNAGYGPGYCQAYAYNFCY